MDAKAYLTNDYQNYDEDDRLRSRFPVTQLQFIASDGYARI